MSAEMVSCILYFSMVLCGAVNIHIVPHTHLDPMWRSTPSEYQEVVDKILSSSIQSLLENRNRTFAWESMHFLHNFLLRYGEISSCGQLTSNPQEKKCFTFRGAVKFLLESGQLEFVGGGWTAQDEALTDFYGSLDDLSLGRRYIRNEFGEK